MWSKTNLLVPGTGDKVFGVGRPVARPDQPLVDGVLLSGAVHLSVRGSSLAFQVETPSPISRRGQEVAAIRREGHRRDSEAVAGKALNSRRILAPRVS